MADLVQAFRVRYPEFDNIPDARLEAFIEDAKQQVSYKIWGDLYQQGVLALAAHSLKTSPSGVGKGNASPFPVSNKTAGSLSIGYAVPTTGGFDEAIYSSTVYGQKYVQLRKLVGVHIKAVPWPAK